MPCARKCSRVLPVERNNDVAMVTLSPAPVTAFQVCVSTLDQELGSGSSDPYQGNVVSNKKKLLKIFILVMTPTMMLTALICFIFYTAYINHIMSSATLTMWMSVVKLGHVVHYLQEERDTSALYISSTSNETKSLLLIRYANTDTALMNVPLWTAGGQSIREEFQSKNNFLTYLNQHRYELDTLNHTSTAELKLYSSLIRVFISNMKDAIKDDQSKKVWGNLVAFQEMVSSKEHMAIERTLGTIFYASGNFSSKDVYLWFLESHDVMTSDFTSGRRYSRLLRHLYGKDIKIYELLLDVIARMRAEIRRDNLGGRGSAKMAEWWHRNITLYMDLLLRMQRSLEENISQMLAKIQAKNIKKMAVICSLFMFEFLVSTIIILVIYSLAEDKQKYCVTLSERFNAVEIENTRINSLIHTMLPKSMVDLLCQHKDVQPKWHGNATVCMCDIRDFAKVFACISPADIFDVINKMVMCFDQVINNYNVYKVEANGDAYLAVSGVSKQNDNLHASKMCAMAIEFMRKNEQMAFADNHNWFKPRIGIHTGPVMTVVVGTKIPKYCLVGETVAVVTKIASLATAGRIQISQSTYDALGDNEEFTKGQIIDQHVEEELEEFASMAGQLRTFYIIRPDEKPPILISPVLSLNDNDLLPIQFEYQSTDPEAGMELESIT